MSINVIIDIPRLERVLEQTVVKKVAEEKVRQLRRASLREFDDDTGALRDPIRLEGDSIAAIGDREHAYWQYVRRFRRGDGRLWVRRVLRDGNTQALLRAQNALGR